MMRNAQATATCNIQRLRVHAQDSTARSASTSDAPCCHTPPCSIFAPQRPLPTSVRSHVEPVSLTVENVLSRFPQRLPPSASLLVRCAVMNTQQLEAELADLQSCLQTAQHQHQPQQEQYLRQTIQVRMMAAIWMSLAVSAHDILRTWGGMQDCGCVSYDHGNLCNCMLT